MSDDIPEEIVENVQDSKPESEPVLKVKIEKEETKPDPDFDYDDYLPTQEEIEESEKEMHEQAEKRKVSNA